MTAVRRLAERRPLALVVAGVLVFSVGPLLVRVTKVSGPVVSFWRLWFGVVILGVATAVQLRSTRRLPSRAGWTWAAKAGLAFAVHQLFFMTAIKATSVVDVTLMQVLQPVVVAVLAVPLFGERPGARFRLWSLVALAGAAVVALAGSSGPTGDLGGMVLAMLNVVLYAVYFVWAKQARDEIDVVPFLFGVVVTAGVAVSAWCVLTGEAVTSVRRVDLLAAFAIAALPGAVGHFLSTWPLRWVAANVPPLLQLAIPFLSGAMAWLLLDERITLAHVLGGALTMAGVAGAILSPAGRRLVAKEDATLATGSG